MSYVIITPAYNEAQNIVHTIQSVIRQTIHPVEWIIVDDGSTDNTVQVIIETIQNYPWIKLFSKQKEPVDFGVHAVVNFYYGYEKLQHKDVDFIVKLDADIILDRDDYFEYQLKRFSLDPKLGISSGVTYYMHDGQKKTVMHPEWRTTGAMKMYRKKCFDQIGGLIPIYGWDGIDDYKAMFNGWETRTFFELEVNHLEKKRDLKRKKDPEIFKKQGVSYYQRGFPFEFVLAKFFQIFFKIGLKEAKNFFGGYLTANRNGVKQVVSRDEKKFISRFQYKRLFS